MKKVIGTLFCFGILVIGLSAQNRFAAGLSIGVNLAQLDGDTYAGYRRPGLEAGVSGIVIFSDRISLSTQMLFSQRGAQPSEEERLEDFDNYIKVRLAYLEVPFLFQVKTGKIREGYYPYQVFGGVSFARLIHSNIQEVGQNVNFYPYLQLEDVEEEFENFDFSLILGLQRNITPVLGAYLKHTLTLKGLYEPDAQSPFNRLESFHFSLGLTYTIH